MSKQWICLPVQTFLIPQFCTLQTETSCSNRSKFFDWLLNYLYSFTICLHTIQEVGSSTPFHVSFTTLFVIVKVTHDIEGSSQAKGPDENLMSCNVSFISNVSPWSLRDSLMCHEQHNTPMIASRMHLVYDSCMCLNHEYQGYCLYTTSLGLHPPSINCGCSSFVSWGE